MCLHLKRSTGRGQDFPITLKSPHATSLLITVISNKLPDKTPSCFHSSVKATRNRRALRVRSGCQSRLSLGGTWSLSGGLPTAGDLPTAGYRNQPHLAFLDRHHQQSNTARPRCVCRDVQPSQTKLSAAFHTTRCLPFAHLDSANSLTHPRISHMLLGHMPSA